MSEETDSLIAEWGEENVQKAFWLQNKIKEDGLDGIHYMEKAEQKADQTKGIVTKAIVEAELEEEY